jgi:Tol biopolymer transport system component
LLFVAGNAQAELIYGRLVPVPPETEANGASRDLDVAANGKVLAFSSLATNWLPGANSPNDKVIVVDLAAGSIEEVSRTGAGAAIAGIVPSLSRDGRYVTFANNGGNLDVGVPTSGWQIVRKDRLSGELRLVSASAGGTPADREARDASISGDGNVVVFRSWATNLGFNNSGGYYQAFAKYLDTGALVAVSVTTGGTLPNADTVLTPHALSNDGRFVAFVNTAAGMVSGVGSGMQVYLRDLQTNTTELISRSSSGDVGNSQSDWAAVAPGGRFVSFRSFASNLGGSASTNSGADFF